MDKLDKKWNEIAPHAEKRLWEQWKEKNKYYHRQLDEELSAKKQRVTTNHCTVLNLVIAVNFTIYFLFFSR